MIEETTRTTVTIEQLKRLLSGGQLFDKNAIVSVAIEIYIPEK